MKKNKMKLTINEKIKLYNEAKENALIGINRQNENGGNKIKVNEEYINDKSKGGIDFITECSRKIDECIYKVKTNNIEL